MILIQGRPVTAYQGGTTWLPVLPNLELSSLSGYNWELLRGC